MSFRREMIWESRSQSFSRSADRLEPARSVVAAEGTPNPTHPQRTPKI